MTRAWLLLVVVGCSSHYEAADSVHLQGLPRCSPGHHLTKPLRVRIEKGRDFGEGPIDPVSDVFAAGLGRDWVGKRVMVKICDAECSETSMLAMGEATVGGTAASETVQLPMLKMPVACDDGAAATQ
ncbi:MAG: hypothetical protein QM831_00250 [Kofleriaceae bacterium]